MAHGESLLDILNRNKRFEWLQPMLPDIIHNQAQYYADLDLGGNVGFKVSLVPSMNGRCIFVNIWRWWPAKDVVSHSHESIELGKAYDLFPELKTAGWNKDKTKW